MGKRLDYFQSEGDVEITLLYENQKAFREIINEDLFHVSKGADYHQVMFPNNSCYRWFYVNVWEMLSTKEIILPGKTLKLSLFSGSQWLREKYPLQAMNSGLIESTSRLSEWLGAKREFKFWSGNHDEEFVFELPRKDLIRFAANIAKHNPLSLGRLFYDLSKLLKQGGQPIPSDEVMGCIEPFEERLNSHLYYYSTYFVEMLYKYFESVNRFIERRYSVNKTNDTRKMIHPKGASSYVFKDLYGSVLVFRPQIGSREHLCPNTPKSLKDDLRY